MRSARASTSAGYQSVCLVLLFTTLCLSSLTGWWLSVWRVPLLEWAAMAVAALALVPALVGGSLRLSPGILPFFLCLVWGAVQIAANWTVYRYRTELSVLWGFSLFCLFWASRLLLQDRATRHRFLQSSLVFAVVATMAGTAVGRFGVRLAPGYFSQLEGDVRAMGGFASYSEYAEFAEVFIPLGVWNAIRRRGEGWPYWLAVGILLVAVIGRGSRAGMAVAVCEIILTATVMLPSERRRQLALPLILLGVISAASLALVIQTQRGVVVDLRSPSGHRLSMAWAAIRMWRDHPLTGVGLGNFQTVHPAYATFDVGLLINEAHDDFLQMFAEGGLVFGGLLIWLAASHWRSLRRSPWALGLAGLFIHSWVDFPFHRSAVVGWAVMLLGSLPVEDGQKQEKLLPR